MTSERQYSDEYLNSFIDNELTAREKSRLYQHSNEDEALNRRICELRKMHELVQLAYKHPPAAAKSGSAHPTPRLRHGVAASFALILGALIGWQYIGPTVDDWRIRRSRINSRPALCPLPARPRRHRP